jgi:glutamyl-tRNA synthetase
MNAPDWTKAEISARIKDSVTKHGLKMPQLMMPMRVLITGQTQTPSIDAIMEILGRDETVFRLASRPVS